MDVEAVKKLISLVKEKPIIYNNEAGFQKNKVRHNLAWKTIASKMGYTEDQCKRRWTALRNCYARALRERRDNKPKQKIWYLEEHLTFLDSYILLYRKCKKKPPESPSMYKESNTCESSPQLLPSDSLNSKVSAQLSPVVAEPVAEKSTLKMNPVPIITIEDDEEDEPKVHSNPIIPVEDPESNNYTQTFLINEITSPTVDSNEKSADDQGNSSNRLFLQSLLLDMNKLPERKQRIFKRKTLALMEDLFDNENS